MKLYEIKESYMRLFGMIDETTDPELVENAMEEINDDLDEKADAYAAIIINKTKDSEALKAEAKRLMEAAKVIDNNIDRMKKSLQDTMKIAGKTKAGTDPRWKITIAKNGGVEPIEITGKVPKKYMVVPEPQPDKKAIREFLKEHPKCKWAKIGERGESLRIK